MTALLLIAAALLVPQAKNEAEELFKKMEAKLAKAKTVQVKVSGAMEDLKFKMSGELSLDEGGKARIEMVGKADQQTVNAGMVSDGKRVRVHSSNQEEPRRYEAPETLGRLIRNCLARAGVMGAFDVVDGESGAKVDPDIAFVASGFKLGPREKVGEREAQAVLYRLARKGEEDSSATVWIDPETHLPLKREVKMERQALTESYSGFTLDEKVDPAKFELPKPEK